VPPRRRLTVALVLTGSVANEIDGMRRALGASALERIAPHCTLVPPVNVREESLTAVLDHVRSAAATSAPVTLTLGPPATFWPSTPVLYLRVGGDVDSVRALRDHLVTGPLAPPAERSERPFVPHVTLDQRIDPARLSDALAALADYRATYCFERVTVMEQDAGHRWQPLADTPLGKPKMAGRGSLDLEISVVDRPGPDIAGWADELWAQYSREQYGQAVRAIKPFAVVVRSGGLPVGFADGEIRGAACRLGRLAVRPDWRGQGVGSHVLRAVEQLGLERGCESIRLETLSGGRAEQFYTERGYKLVAPLPRWREGRDFVLMERAVVVPPAPLSRTDRERSEEGVHRRQ
jgi:2'-5' RNA ligase/ribosomal protein S18 acetylase RimI-like enzyme